MKHLKRGIALFVLVLLVLVANSNSKIEPPIGPSKVSVQKETIASTTKFIISPEEIILEKSPVKNNLLVVEKNIKSYETIEKISNSLALYRKKIVMNFQKNAFPLQDFIVSIRFDTLSLINESKLSISCDLLYFADEDGKTIIPHWIEKNTGRVNAKIWLRVPLIKPNSQKTIFFYYTKNKTKSRSNFASVFKPTKDLVGWYLFNDVSSLECLDLSGNSNMGTLSELEIGQDWGTATLSDPYVYVFFNGWGNGGYFSYPIPKKYSLNSVGSVETFLRLYNLTQKVTQRIFVDSRQQIELGILPDGKMYFQLGNDTNRIIWNTDMVKNSWYHLVFTWSVPDKKAMLFLYGKEIKPVSGQKSFQWKKIPLLGDLKFGGYHTGKDYGLVGYLDNLRIYNRVLNAQEINYYYHINQRFNRFPQSSVSKEEKVSVIRNEQEMIDFSKVCQFPKISQVKVKLVYATPLNDDYFEDQKDQNERVKNAKNFSMIIDRTKKETNPVFGFVSHFYPYIGTEISIEKPNIVKYIGFKMSNKNFVKKFSVEFLRIVDYKQSEYYEERSTGFLDFLIPQAYACGPFYDYKKLGSSDLQFVTVSNGTSWFKLIEPQLIDLEVTIMQLSYLPNPVRGNMSLEVSDILVENESNQISRATLVHDYPTEQAKRDRTWIKLYMAPKYLATMGKIENGNVDFAENIQHGLDLRIENQGDDTIKITPETLKYIKNNLFISLAIFDWTKKTIKEIYLDDLEKYLLNKEIPVGYLLTLPILDKNWLPKNSVFYLTYYGEPDYSSNYDFYRQSAEPKIISWTIGNNPYQYDLQDIDSFKIMYELWISNEGKFHFIETKNKTDEN
jgi:hypothetical protein